jgi:dienelactone hydrolase
VLALVAAEYNADTTRVFVHGQNPSGSAAMHLAAKYPDMINAIVVSSGPIVTASYPFENLQGKVAVMMLHGDMDDQNTAAASERVTKELQDHGVEAEFHLVPGGVHLTAYLTFAKEIFDFLDQH